jgi:tetratricopeptide (TPR) repeat protein
MRMAGADGLGEDARWRVFISHTSELREFPKGQSYVAAVERAVSAAGHVIVDMKDFPAADQAPGELCAERVRRCDVYVGVLGTRYGSPVRDRPEVSYTELEFDTATEVGLDRLVFVLDTSVENVGIPVSALIDHEFGARQEAFRARVQNGGLATQSFTDPATLGQLVERSLRELAEKRQRTGSRTGRVWVPSATVAEQRVIHGAQMARSLELPRDIYRPSRLLDPVRGVVDFIGREAELRSLVAWCKDDTGPKVRLITGPGGVGKTRLGLRLAEWLEELGWQSFRVGDGYEADIVPNIRESDAEKALLVVDYAETRTKLADLLRSVAVDDGKLKVLLLARDAGQWWQQLTAAEPAIRDLIADAGPEGYALGQVLDAELSDEDLVRQAVPFFARVLEVDPPDHVQITARTGRSRVLELHAAALVAILNLSSESQLIVQVSLANVMGELLAHEERFWVSSARAQGLLDGPEGLTVEKLRQIIAVACLLGARDGNDALNLLHRVSGVPNSVKIATWIRGLYPPESSNEEWVGALQPDRLAELHVVKELDHDPELAHRCLTGLSRYQIKRALTVLAHASTELAAAAGLLRQLLVSAEEDLAEVDASHETLTTIAIATDVPYPSTRLARVQVTILGRIIDSLPASTEPSVHGQWLYYYGLKLSQLESGRAFDGIKAMEEALNIYRTLAADRPALYRPQLAKTLISLSTIYARWALNVNSFDASEEGVAIFEELAESNPAEYLQSLARALSTHSYSLTMLSRLREAREVVQRALTTFDGLAVTNPDGTKYDMAVAKFRLVRILERAEDYEAALEIAWETLPTLEEFATNNPDAYQPSLMAALFDTVGCLKALGRWEDAIRILNDGVTILRELRVLNPTYHIRLAGRLRELADLLSKVGNYPQAMIMRAEADREAR